ncbi:hypothetical protein OG840_21460 [Streptomyces sp. NBC_01764]|uniref:hypothetical protein n=1 Tax=Streptomyces sp. NBC_01764 TaxID=2975935 RepID=UPI00225433EC|nr:hypothetical protein [Streptomyces sp. NBC_01764]MCX4404211.1 hypothetical protein [Streptomyces sp. NBC_01764]
MAHLPRADVVQGLRQPRPARLARATRASTEGDQAPLHPAAAALAVADLGHRTVGSARVRGVGCGHFRTDVSYLPDLESYLADLLRNRERLLAAVDADDWAKAEALPSDEEISRVRRLIRRVKDSVDELGDEERSEIEQATALVRRVRNSVVHLGLPRIRQPLPDIRPNRTA